MRFAVPATLLLPVALAAVLASCADDPMVPGGRELPTVTLTAPAAGAALEADSMVVEGVAEDDREVRRVAYRLNGGAEESVAIQAAERVSFRFVVRGLKLGPIELEVAAYDAGEQKGEQKVALTRRDVAAPLLQLLTPADSARVESDSVRITGTIQDDSAVTALAYVLDGAPERPLEIAPVKQGTFGFTLRPSAGPHTLVVRARDASGNSSEDTVRFTIPDLTVPFIHVLTPTEGSVWTDEPVRVTGMISDDSAVVALAYVLNDAPERVLPITPVKQGNFGFTLHPAPGNHTLVVRARDGAGNSSEQTVRFTTSAPYGIRITSPRADTTIGRFAVTLKLSATTEQPVRRVTMSLNGGPEVTRCSGLCGELLADSLRQGRNTINLVAYAENGHELGSGRTTVIVSVPVKRYTLRYLGTLPGDLDSRGGEVNEAGQVAGWSANAGRERAFAWDGSKLVDLSAALGTESQAFAINASGVVVGRYTTDCVRAFRLDLGSAAGPSQVMADCALQAVDVNDSGTVLVTTVGASGPADRGYLVDSGGARALVLQSCLDELLRLNNAGQVLGNAGCGAHGPNGAYYSTSAAPDRETGCWAVDMNNQGDIASVGACHSSMWFLEGRVGGIQLKSIGVEPGSHGRTNPSALNDLKEATGLYPHAYRNLELVGRPFLWTGGQMYDVDYAAPDWEIDSVTDLNNGRTILAHGRNTRTGQQGAVLLVPND